MNWQMDWAWW